GANGALGVVLVPDGSAEEGHHRVADELLDGAAVALQLLPETGLIWREELCDILGIHLLRARSEADKVAEEDGHDLALFARERYRFERRSAARAEASIVRVLTPAARTDVHASEHRPPM